MLNRKMIGVFKVHDPDNLLDSDTYGYMVYNTVDPDDTFCYICTIKSPPNIDWEKHPILKDAVYIDVTEEDEDGDEHYTEKPFSVHYKLLPQNAFGFSKLCYDEYIELQDIARRGRLKDLEQLFNKLKEPLKSKYMLDNGLEEEE